MSDEPTTVIVTAMTPDGEASAPFEHGVVLVPGLFVGETARVRIVARSRHHARAHGEVAEIVDPHPARREPPCQAHADRAGRCTGCPWMGLGEEAQRAQKQAMLASLGLAVDRVELAPVPLGYRMSSKRIAFGRVGTIQLGSFVRGSHVTADMAGCLVDHPRIEAAARAIAAAASAAGVTAYREATRRGALRAVWLKTDGTRVLATLVLAQTDRAVAQSIAARTSGVDAIAWSAREDEGNVLRGDEAEMLVGDPTMAARVAGVEVKVGPLGFLQPNPAAIEKAYLALVSSPDGALLEGGRAIDLYAGAGVTTALLRARFRDVRSVEVHAESAAALSVQPETSEAFLAGYAEGAPDLVVANPPRKGLGAAVVTPLRALGAARLHVMSCGPESLARDLAALTAEGAGARYRVVALRAFDTLPQTPHVEVVAWLERVS